MLAAIYITSFVIILTIWSVAYLLEKKLIEIKKEIERLKQIKD
jgi:hypothetical protein